MKQGSHFLLLLFATFTLQIHSQTTFSPSLSQNPLTGSKNSRFRHIFSPLEALIEEPTNNNINEEYPVGSDNDGSDTAESYVPIMALAYYGSWSSTGPSDVQTLDFFSQSSGYAEFTANDQGLNGLDDGINVWIYDGPYKDQKSAYINFVYDNTTDFDPENASFSNPNILFEVTLQNNGAYEGARTCNGSYQLNFIDSYTKGPYQKSLYDYENAVAEFTLTSPDCNIYISLNTAVDDSADESKAMEYTMIVTLICVGHLYACIQLIRQISLNDADGARYSLITFSLFTAWDVFLCLFHFYGALTTEVYFHYFITPAFWYFILASILEARLLLLIWKAKYYQSFQTVQDLRSGLTWFYAEFYGFLAVFLLACYFVVPETWFFYLTSFFFVPQIIHNAIRGQKYKFDFNYVFLLGVLRIFVPLYVKAYPESMFRYTPSDHFGLFYIGIVFSQVMFLYLQSKMGSRFFVPGWVLPPPHNYFVKIAYSEETDLCAICMEGLSETSSDSTTELLKNEKYFTVMQTPCKHNFHEKCLKEWMEIKLECPFCRTNLPIIE